MMCVRAFFYPFFFKKANLQRSRGTFDPFHSSSSSSSSQIEQRLSSASVTLHCTFALSY
jgi:hypothetical protein